MTLISNLNLYSAISNKVGPNEWNYNTSSLQDVIDMQE